MDFALTEEEKDLLLDRREKAAAGAGTGAAEKPGAPDATGKPMTGAEVDAAIKNAATTTAKAIEADRQKAEVERQRDDQRSLAQRTVRKRAEADPQFAAALNDSPSLLARMEMVIGDALQKDKEVVGKLNQEDWLKRLDTETDKAMETIRKEAAQVSGITDGEAASRLKAGSTGTGSSGTGRATGAGDNSARPKEPEEIPYGTQDMGYVYPGDDECEKRHQDRLAHRDSKAKAGV